MWRVQVPWMWHRVDWDKFTDVSEERLTSVFRVEEKSKQSARCLLCVLFDSEDGSSAFPRNVYERLSDYTRWFATLITRAHDKPLSWATWIQSILSHPISLRFILILSSHPRFCLRSGLLYAGFRTKMRCVHIFTPIHAVCPVHHILLELFILIIFGGEYKLCRSSLCSFLHSPITFSLLIPNILSKSMFFL
jgi:hypothetical protein